MNNFEKLSKVMKPTNPTFWKRIVEEASFGALGTAPCPTANGPITSSGCTVNGIPVAGKSTKKKKSKKNENKLTEVVNYNELATLYEADTLEDLKELDLLQEEDTLQLVQEKDNTCKIIINITKQKSLFTLNVYDEDGDTRTQPVLSYTGDKVEIISILNDPVFLEQLEVLKKDPIKNFKEKYEEISDRISKQLDRLNFEFADTKDIIYKKEGEYKYLIKFNNENGVLKFKIIKDENGILEKEWQLEQEQDITPIFDEIEEHMKNNK